MSSVLVVIFEIGPKYSAQVAFSEHNDMVSAFAANTPVQSLNVRVLPRAAKGC